MKEEMKKEIEKIIKDIEEYQPEMIIKEKPPFFWKLNPIFVKDKTDKLATLFDSQIEEGDKKIEQLEVQLAGCATAALGWNSEPAKQGDYGWSPAYQDVLDLRIKFDSQIDRIRGEIEGMAFDKGKSDITQKYQETFIDGYNQAIEEVAEKFNLKSKSVSVKNGECVTSRTTHATNKDATYLKDIESTPTKSKSGGIK